MYIYLHTYAYAYICTRTHTRMHDTVHTLNHWYWDPQSMHKYAYTQTHIQNVHMNARMHAWNDGTAANVRGAVADAGSFARLFRSTQSNHISHLHYKDFIVPPSWNTNASPPPIPSFQHTPEQFADCGQAQFYCSTLIRWTECIALKLRAASQWPLA